MFIFSSIYNAVPFHGPYHFILHFWLTTMTSACLQTIKFLTSSSQGQSQSALQFRRRFNPNRSSQKTVKVLNRLQHMCGLASKHHHCFYITNMIFPPPLEAVLRYLDYRRGVLQSADRTRLDLSIVKYSSPITRPTPQIYLPLML